MHLCIYLKKFTGRVVNMHILLVTQINMIV